MTKPHVWRPSTFLRLSAGLHVAALGFFLVQPHLWMWPLLALALNHAVITAIGLWPRSDWLGPNLTRLPPAAAKRGEIALTIDDGPDPDVTPKVLDLLDRHRMKATFFCIGVRAARYPEICREIIARGHAIENHTQHHRHTFSLLGIAGIGREVQAAQQTLGAITGRMPLFFRAPAGLRNPFLDPVLSRHGLRLASWSSRGFDTRTGDAQRVVRRLKKDLRPGAILLLHDGNAARTIEGVPVILAVLPVLLDHVAAAGLRSVPLSAAFRTQEP